jgi:hypothetical protein
MTFEKVSLTRENGEKQRENDRIITNILMPSSLIPPKQLDSAMPLPVPGTSLGSVHLGQIEHYPYPILGMGH